MVVTAWSAGDDNIGDVLIQGDGKILGAGKGYLNEDGSDPYYVASYNTNGSLDDGSGNDSTPGDSLGAAGAVATPFGGQGLGTATQGNPLALQPDGSIVYARSRWNGTDTDLAMARFAPPGWPQPPPGWGVFIDDLVGDLVPSPRYSGERGPDLLANPWGSTPLVLARGGRGLCVPSVRDARGLP